MEELKTLKDMEIWNGCEGDVNELQQEAIKRIMYYMKLSVENPKEWNSEILKYSGRIDELKEFFNITDEDLKK